MSVVVPAYNEERGLEASLRSIRAAMAEFDRVGWASELIVCDNNSTDRTAAIARACGAAVVFEARNQIARARNTGAAHASGDWLLFVDADSHPSPALFADVVEAVASGRHLAGGSVLTFGDSRRLVRLAEWAWNSTSRLHRWAAGSFIFCDAAVFREVGGFDETLYAAEEIELFRRLKRRARAERRRIVILRRHPLLTSGRKIDLYSPRELLLVLLRAALTGGRSLRSAHGTFTWYDGRR